MVASSRKVRFVCVSDTHNHSPGEGYTLPKGDVLIHAGDLTNQGSKRELEKAAEWLRNADFLVKIVVAGNHDLALDSNYEPFRHPQGWHITPDIIAQDAKQILESIPNVHYLQHTSCEVSLPRYDDDSLTLRMFGSPFSPDRGRQNWAFQYPQDTADALWEAIPIDTDVLVTHTPPAGHCDASRHWQEGGCSALTAKLARVKPVLHICGHCHEGRGAEAVRWRSSGGETASDDEVKREEVVRTWKDPGEESKKQSLLNLTGSRRSGNGGDQMASLPFNFGQDTAIVNASIMAKSWSARGGSKAFNKPIVVDVDFGSRAGQQNPS